MDTNATGLDSCGGVGLVRLAGWQDGLYSERLTGRRGCRKNRLYGCMLCDTTCSVENKKNKLRNLDTHCGASSLFVSQPLSVPECSCSIALVWARGSPKGVCVPQHTTVNPPAYWWLLIRYSDAASCPEENRLWPPLSSCLIIPLSIFTVALPAAPSQI